MSYRDDVTALTVRHAALTVEVQEKTRELEAASALLAEAKAKAKLPVLPNIRVAAPCKADWNAMVGDERVRECAKCDKRVYNLSNMTRDEAEALIVEKEGRLCVRYFQRRDGTIILKDCEVGVSSRRKRRLIAAGTAALLAGSAGAAMTLSSRTNRAPSPDRVEIQGGISWSDETRQDTRPVEPAGRSNAQAMMGEGSMSNPVKDQ
jgi:hypothetical protein